MLPIFESIVPIFLLIVLGNFLRRMPFIDDKAWPGLEQLGFWFLYPALRSRPSSAPISPGCSSISCSRRFW